MKFNKVIIVLLVILFLSINITYYVFAEEITNNTNVSDSVDSKIEDLENKKNDLNESTNKSSSQLEFVQDELGTTVKEITELSQKIYDKQTELDELEKKIEILNNEYKDIEKEMNNASEEYENQKKLLEKRLVNMYEMGNTSYLDMLLSSKKLSEFISNYYYISLITEYDYDFLQLVLEKKENVEKYANELQKNKDELRKIEENLKKEKIALSNYVTIKNQKLANLNEEEANLQREIEEYQSQMQQIESEIKILTLTSGNADYVGGFFSWPVPGYSNITSVFGMRTHPITGIYKLHTGIDIGAPMGANFVAANDGIVIKAGYNTAYGNMVIIDHGGGISTLYAHGSAILVNCGDIVKKGTPVLSVGSTGYSTGAHAHFEIRVNSEYVNPIEYIENNINDIETEIVEIDQTKEE